MKHALLAFSAVLAFPVLVAAFQHAQQQSLDSLEQLYPGPFGEADFREVVAGEFTGDLELDAALIDGGHLVLAVAPEIFDGAIGTDAYPTAFAVLPGVVQGKDLLLVADEHGLRSFEYDTAAGAWIVVTLFDAESDWAGAVELTVGDLDGADGLDVAAVNAAGDQVLIAHGAGDGSFLEGTPFGIIGPPTFLLRLLNWREVGDVAGTDEIALGSAIGVGIFEADGTYLGHLAVTMPNMRMAVIGDSGTPVERLVLHGKASGIDYLRIYGALQSTTFFSIGQAGVVSLATGDVDGDGDTELFLSVNSERKVWMLENQSPATPTFDTANIQKFTYGPPARDPAWNLAGLAIADFDSDGVPDVLAPAQGGTIQQSGGVLLPVYGTLPLVHVGAADPGAWRVGIDEVTCDLDTRVLGVLMSEPDSVLASAPGAETMLQVSVWHTPAFGLPTTPLAYHSSLIALPDPLELFTLQLPAGYSTETSPDIFSFVVRQVSVANGEIVEQASALTAIFVSAANADLVESIGETYVFIPSWSLPDSPTPVGGLGMGPTVPPLPDDQMPGR